MNKLLTRPGPWKHFQNPSHVPPRMIPATECEKNWKNKTHRSRALKIEPPRPHGTAPMSWPTAGRAAAPEFHTKTWTSYCIESNSTLIYWYVSQHDEGVLFGATKNNFSCNGSLWCNIHPYTCWAPLHDQRWNPGVSTRFLGIALHATGLALSLLDPAPASWRVPRAMRSIVKMPATHPVETYCTITVNKAAVVQGSGIVRHCDHLHVILRLTASKASRVTWTGARLPR